jgi:hypothetical protein
MLVTTLCQTLTCIIWEDKQFLFHMWYPSLFIRNGLWSTTMWSCVTQIPRNGYPSHVGDRKAFKVMTSTQPWVVLTRTLLDPRVSSGWVVLTRTLLDPGVPSGWVVLTKTLLDPRVSTLGSSSVLVSTTQPLGTLGSSSVLVSSNALSRKSW